jgi:hypothetical protein
MQFMTYHFQDLHAGQDRVKANLLVAVLQKSIFDQHGRQATETGKVRRVWLYIWIVQRLHNHAEPSNQVFLPRQTSATTMLDFHVQFNLSQYSKWVRHFFIN